MLDLHFVWTWIRSNYPLLMTMLELVISTVGFAFTITELRRTKNALEASQEATKRTLQAMADRLTIADISRIQGRLSEVQVALRGSRYEIALVRTQEARMDLAQLKRRAGFASDSRSAQVQMMVFRLRKLQNLLESRLASPTQDLAIPAANDALSDIIDSLSEWTEETRFSQRSRM